LLFLASINRFIDTSGVKTALSAVGLDPDDKRTVGKYSLGMKQRLSIAQAIMENPDYLLLDEPTNALDKEGVVLVQNLISQQAQSGTVVIIASHSKEDIDLLCDVMIFMEEGKVIDIAETQKVSLK
jgi:ABC-2 type transport system ATP-binding protein